MKEHIYRYVPWGRVDDFLAMGWILPPVECALASEWSVFMFACECNPHGKAPDNGRTIRN
jgi:hypothetical protein